MPGAERTLFAYGTLMFAPVLRAVTGLERETCPARLDGYARYAVRGQPWPALVEETGAHTEGCLVLSLPARAWPLLDAFEGDFYTRIAVTVRCADGTTCAAQTYLARPAARTRLSPRPWSPVEFRRRHLARYLAAWRR
ncbi:MAG: gamma-glutamylcyclotransferase family protein [Gammaproteobacteria bacterium]